MSSPVLLIGLGNPGPEYEVTRHNFGFLALDYILHECARSGTVTELSGKRDPYALWRITTGHNEFFATKPLTYMNRSGEPVQHILHYYKLLPQNCFVLHDELDIAFGRLKLKVGGSNAGHNGLKSLQHMLGTPDFYRLRLGVGKPAGFDTASYVLSRFSSDERSALPNIFSTVSQTFFLFLQGKFAQAQQFCNSFALPSP